MAAGPLRNWSTVRRKLGKDFGCPCLSKDAQPELCVKLIQRPSIQNYSGLKTVLQQASEEWMNEFLELGGMGVLLQSLERLGNSQDSTGFLRAVMQFECACCIKFVLNSSAGLNYMSENIKFTRQLGRGLESFY